MKIAFDIRGIDGDRGGKGIWTANVLKSILNNDRENEYYLYTNKDWKNIYKHNPNVHVMRVWGKGPLWHLRFYWSMLKNKIDILIATESYIVPFLHDPKKLHVALVVHDLVAADIERAKNHRPVAELLRHRTIHFELLLLRR